MGSIANLDALVEDRRGATVRVVGQEWPLPPELPHRALVYLDGLQGEHGPDYRLNYQETMLLARLIFGEETVAAWVEAGIGPDRLPGVVERTILYLAPRQISPIRPADAGDDGGSPP